MNTKIVAITNQKGGVGKTTTATCLAAGLQEAGKKTLLIDFDPQCNSTDVYHAEVEGVAILYDVLLDGYNALEAVQHTEEGDIIAGDIQLMDAEKDFSSGFNRFKVFEKAAAPLMGEYEYIILDTPPHIGVLLRNALFASTTCIVPLTPERFSFQGLSDLASTISELQEFKPEFKIAGLLLVRVNQGRSLAKDTLESIPEISNQLGTKCFKTVIREAEAVKKSQASRMTIYHWEKQIAKRKIPVADDYRAFVKEFIKEVK